MHSITFVVTSDHPNEAVFINDVRMMPGEAATIMLTPNNNEGFTLIPDGDSSGEVEEIVVDVMGGRNGARPVMSAPPIPAVEPRAANDDTLPADDAVDPEIRDGAMATSDVG